MIDRLLVPPAPPVPPLLAAVGRAPEVVPPPVDDNPHKLVARYRKARRIAQAIIDAGGDADATLTVGQTELGRTLAARVAGTHVPSEVTWALVFELVREQRP
jgi:hypothetical protein